jgi:hypothetical protein
VLPAFLLDSELDLVMDVHQVMGKHKNYYFSKMMLSVVFHQFSSKHLFYLYCGNLFIAFLTVYVEWVSSRS